MRILFVGTRRGFGGTEAHLVETAIAMADAGHHVSAAVWPHDRIHDALERHGGVHLLPARFRYASDIAGTRDLWRAARAARAEWILASFRQEYYSAALVARLLPARVAIFKHTDLPARRLSLFVLPRLADRFLVPSEFLRRHFLELGMPPDRVNVVLNPADTDHFRPDPQLRSVSRTRLGFDRDDVVIGFVGRVEADKGAPALYEALQLAMRRDARVRALWVGHGNWAAHLASLTDRDPLGHRHHCVGDVTDVLPFYLAMDVATLPSTRSETFGRVLIEAQACGLPVLGSNLGGIPEALLDGGTGLLVTPGDVHAWRDAILRLARTDTAAAMAAAARPFVLRHFAAPRIAADLQRALQSPSAPRA